jgi:alpha-beta hydrolase superfamily lysophospholipase
VVVALAVLGIVLLVWRGRTPDPGDFYTPPSSIPATPGTVIRSEPFTRGVPEAARAWRILYSSTDPKGTPIAVSALVVAGSRSSPGPHPVLAWAHGTTGVVSGCAPSLTDQAVTRVPELDRLLARGWVVVATDYPGLGTPGPHPYLVGQSEARSVIDSVRAARALDTGLSLDGRYAVWGESQGGHAGLFTGQIAGTYAPELDLIGVAAFAPASDLAALLAASEGTRTGALLTSETLYAWSRYYPGLSFDDALIPGARDRARRVARRCITSPSILIALAQSSLLPKGFVAIDVPTDPRWSPRVAQNTPSQPVTAPLFVAQGAKDIVVAPSVTRAYVRRRCARGEAVEFREYPDSGHVNIIGAAGDAALAWTEERLAGRPAPSTC